MNEKTTAFLKSAYKEYYFRGAGSIEFPPDPQKREFGYIPFGGSMIRHLSFATSGEAAAEILRQAPSSVYCSNARYSNPTLPMEEKGWEGAELIFDIDATDIPTPCKRGHDIWYCQKCFATGRLPRPASCPTCSGPTAEHHGVCPTCLDASKEHVRRLLDFLTNDFGVARSDISVFFSGNRGYHVQVSDRRFEPLDPQARAEIAEYVKGTSLPPTQTMASFLKRNHGQPIENLHGWTARIALYVESSAKGPSLQRTVSEAVKAQVSLIDASVTTDIHRVFRLAGTLHGNTGMLKMRVQSLEAFDPSRDPVVISDRKVTLKVDFSPRFSINGQTYGPFTSQEVSVPSYAAVPILTRGSAEVA